MQELALSQQLAFVMSQRQEDEAQVLAQALREGIRTLYHETLIEAYLMERIPRETLLQVLGPEQLSDIEYQRDALQCDVAWGQRGARGA